MKKILVVESSPTILSVTDSLLRQNGYDVACLSDSEEALEFARSEHPDLILTGIGLNGFDGLELCKQITGDDLTGGIPVIILIGEKDTPFLEKLPICGARGSLSKPFSPRDLLGIVEKFTDNLNHSSSLIVNQKTGNGPKLKNKSTVTPTEIDSSTRTSLSRAKDTGNIKRHETVFNLDWEDLAGDNTSPDESPDDDSALVLDEDQYGLTSLADEVMPVQNKPDNVEDYDWFINSMRDEIEDTGKPKPQPQPAAAPKTSSGDAGLSRQEKQSETKYRQFLQQFKDEAEESGAQVQSSGASEMDILANKVAEKLAAKIVAQLNSDELKNVIRAILSENK